jgi:hypothetical protein
LVVELATPMMPAVGGQPTIHYLSLARHDQAIEKIFFDADPGSPVFRHRPGCMNAELGPNYAVNGLISC